MAERVQLHKSANPWNPDKVSVEDESEAAKNKLLVKKVRALCNKITAKTKEALIEEFLSYQVPNSTALEEVTEVIHDHAINNPLFCPLYCDLLMAQINTEGSVTNGHSLIHNSIITRAQKTFQVRANDNFVAGKRTEIDAEPDPKKKKEKEVELLEGMTRFRWRYSGNVNFIGQLYLRSLLSTKILHFCIQDLLKATALQSPNNDESIACAVQLLETTGPKLESDLKGSASFDAVLNHLGQLQNAVSKRIKYKIMDLLELRASRWRTRRERQPRRGPLQPSNAANGIGQGALILL